ncbi:hypothetical protein CEY16_02865 [Halalkalibacillus sediminis]|uniref:Uncharacterized protein n=1 Tax=Halalkalibacillus sediminis TaxID=2018042 RepID=A0A2I0QWM6_9BACI|nr:hypothetical protein [Halalkalibacillus sediminis]PKR78714.1 hypothetical protein CEY16_02865 [Halalkalibacillus sediminis]
MSTTIILHITSLIISFAGGFLLFYILSHEQHKFRMKAMEESANTIILLVLYIQLAKVLLKVELFLSDPIAVLSYPSNAASLYLATVMVIIHLWISNQKKREISTHSILSLAVIMIGSSFVYEFLQVTWFNNTLSWKYLFVLFFTLLGYLVVQNRFNPLQQILFIVFIWGAGQLIISITLPFITIFNYMISPLFILSIMLFAIVSIFGVQRKGVN